MLRFTFIFTLLLGPGLRSAVIKPEAEALRTSFPGAARFEPASLSWTAQLRAELRAFLGRPPYSKAPRVLRALDAGGAALGLAFVDEELGKHQPMTYLLALDRQGRIRALELLVFRESQGDGVRSSRFRGQFRGKALSDPLELGRDLDAVSGATISSRALARGARKCLWLARRLDPGSQGSKPEPEDKGGKP